MSSAKPASIDATVELLKNGEYIADRSLATVLYLALKLGRPLFCEGEAGVGKTEIAKVLAATLKRPLIRLQCYEGLDVSSAVYEWNYARQMIEIRLAEAQGVQDRGQLESDIFNERFLIRRPLLQALRAACRGRAGPADRRARPHRRAVRGLPAGGAVRLPGDDPRARHGEGRANADRDHHLQPHARDPRRAEAALLLSLGRLSRPQARAGDPQGQGAGRQRAAVAPGRGLRPGAAQGRPVQVAGRRRDRSTGRPRCRSSTCSTSIPRRSTTRWACC